MDDWQPAQVGMRVSEVDTPALLVDLDVLERNIAQLMRAVPAGVRVRAHAKTHKCAALARLQIAAGAVGMCVQKIGEAEALLRAGIDDILISNQVVGAQKIARLAALVAAFPQAELSICVDAMAQIDQLEGVFSQLSGAEAVQRLGVLVEINAGGNRCGVETPDEALALARRIAASAHLRFEGIQAYHGSAQHLRTPAERRTAIADAVSRARATRDLLAAHGLVCNTVGGAGTGTFALEAASGVYNELQPGSYVFMDADYARNQREAPNGEPGATGNNAPFSHSLFILATVMSRSPTRAVVDVGHKAHSADSGFPLVAGRADLRYYRPSDEHGVIELVADAQQGSSAANAASAAASAAASSIALPALGEKIRLIPGHCDPTVNLHRWFVAYRGDTVEAVWPIEAAGAFY
jgi:3-hydroxy-D-aspartate aldolase